MWIRVDYVVGEYRKTRSSSVLRRVYKGVGMEARKSITNKAKRFYD